MAEDDKVVPLRPQQDLATKSKEELERLEEVRTLIALGRLPVLEYERVRLRSAKAIGCRPSTLDKIVSRVRLELIRFRSFHPSARESNRVTDFYNGGNKVAAGIAFAETTDWEHSLIILADGNASIVQGVPRKDP